MSLKSELKERQAKILELALIDGERQFDASFGLCQDIDPKPKGSQGKNPQGHSVSHVSPAYAEALLATGRDIPRAARILERTCDFQRLDPRRGTHCSFPVVAEWKPGVIDQNAVSFWSLHAGVIWNRFRDLLPQSTRDRLLETFEYAAIGLVRRRPDVFYTNVYLLTLVATILLGKILERPDFLKLGGIQWNCFLDTLARENISEFNSNGYTAIHVECLMALHEHGTTPLMRRQAKAAMEYFLTAYALNYHLPSHAHAGTMSRAKPWMVLSMKSSTDFMAYALFGEPLPVLPGENGPHVPVGTVVWTRSDYVPSAEVREIFARKKFPIAFTERNVSYWGRDYDPKVVERATDQTDLYSLSTQYGVWANYRDYLHLHLTHAGKGQHRAVYFQHEPEFPLIDAWFRQRRDTALGAFFWCLHGYREFREWWRNPPFDATMVAQLGIPDEMISLQLDGKEWDGKRQPKAGSTVLIVKPEIEVRIRFLEAPRGVRTPALRMEMRDRDAIVLMTFGKSENANKFWTSPPAVQPVLLEVRRGGSKSVWKTREVHAVEKRGCLDLSVGTLKVRAPLTLATRDAMAAKTNPPIRKPILESPYFTLSIDDMRKRLGI